MFKVLKSEVYSHLYTVNTIFKKLFYSRTIKSTQTKFIYNSPLYISLYRIYINYLPYHDNILY